MFRASFGMFHRQLFNTKYAGTLKDDRTVFY